MSLYFRLPPFFEYGVKFTINNLSVVLIISAFMAFWGGAAKADQITIAVLGDSLVQGYGLPQDAGFVPQLEGWLHRHGVDVTLINAGVSGDTSAGGLSRVDWTLGPDVDGLILSLGANDALRGIDPDVTRSNLDATLKIAASRPVPVLLVGIIAPGNYGPDYQDRFQAIYPALAEKYGVMFYANFIQALVDLPSRTATLAKYYQGDALHPNADGVALIVGAMGPAVAKLAATLD